MYVGGPHESDMEPMNFPTPSPPITLMPMEITCGPHMCVQASYIKVTLYKTGAAKVLIFLNANLSPKHMYFMRFLVAVMHKNIFTKIMN